MEFQVECILDDPSVHRKKRNQDVKKGQIYTVISKLRDPFDQELFYYLDGHDLILYPASLFKTI